MSSYDLWQLEMKKWWHPPGYHSLYISKGKNEKKTLNLIIKLYKFAVSNENEQKVENIEEISREQKRKNEKQTCGVLTYRISIISGGYKRRVSLTEAWSKFIAWTASKSNSPNSCNAVSFSCLTLSLIKQCCKIKEKKSKKREKNGSLRGNPSEKWAEKRHINWEDRGWEGLTWLNDFLREAKKAMWPW